MIKQLNDDLWYLFEWFIVSINKECKKIFEEKNYIPSKIYIKYSFNKCFYSKIPVSVYSNYGFLNIIIDENMEK